MLDLDKTTWQRVKFGDVVKNANAKSTNPASEGIDRVIAMEHLDPGELAIRRWGTLDTGTTFTRRVTPGQTLFGKRRAYQRKVAYAEFDAICSGDILTFEATPGKLLPELLPFIVQSDPFFERAVGTSAGSLSPRTNWRDLAKFEFDLPPRDVQQHISELLWALERHARSIQDGLQYAASSMEAWREAQLTERETVELGNVLELQHGKPVPSSDYGKGDLRLLRPGDMKSDGDVRWGKNSVSIPASVGLKSKGCMLQPGDLVINMTAQSLEDRFLGRVCRIKDAAFLNQRIGRLHVKAGYSADYVFFVLRSESFSRWVATRSEGSKVKHMHWRHIEKFPFPIADRAWQERISSQSKSYASAINSLQRELDASCRLRSSFLSSFFGDS